jgi:photosystem II stability/assembly factor-like uncharacterized protein
MRKALLFSLAALLIVAMAFGGETLETGKVPVAASGNTVASTKGWLQLTQLPLATYQFPSVQYLDTVAWIAGYKTAAPRLPLAFYSKKGGAWTQVSLPGADRGLFEAWDAKLALYATVGGKIFRTTNGGTSWDSVYYYGAGSGWFDGIRFLNKDTVVAFGDADLSGLLVIRSTDGGATWTRNTNLPAEDAIGGKYASTFTYNQGMDVFGKNVWLSSYETAGTPARLLRSTDAGATWTSWPLTLTGGPSTAYVVYTVNFLDANVGYLVCSGPTTADQLYYHKSTDGGLTWSDTLKVDTVVPHAKQEVRSVKPIRGTNSLVAVGRDNTAPASSKGRTWLSTDGGSTWVPAGGIGGELYNSAFKDIQNILAVGVNNALQYTSKNVRAVTFNLNTATVPDTLPVAGSKIQIRGGTTNAGGYSPITWGNDAQNELTSVGGDYWRKTVYMQVGDTLGYKYVVAYSSGTGWEQGVAPADFPTKTGENRSFIVPDKDTTLNVEFWNNGAGTRAQYFRPWTAVADSFLNVYFRVSMAGQIASGTPNFNNDKDTVAVRGGGDRVSQGQGSDLDWGRSIFLTRESGASNGDGYTTPATNYWSGRLRFKKDSVNAGQSISYKFLLGDAWGRDELQGQSNRAFTIPVGKKDTTLKYVYYNNEKPGSRANPDTVKITYIADLGRTAASGGINVLTDTLWVRSGYFSTSATPGSGKRMARLSGTIFQVIDTVITAKKKPLDYQYYVVRNGAEVRESYYNFYYTGPLQSEAEKRQVIVDSLASKLVGMTIRDTSVSVTQARRQPLFPNARVLARNVNVKWEVDLRPAYYQVKLGNDSLSDIQGVFTVRQGQQDSIMKWGVWMNGPAVGGWGNPGTSDWGLGLQQNLLKKLFDNGTNGDRIAGDSIFTRQVQASPDSILVGTKGRVGQEFKFGIRGGDNEGGKGGFGNNHYANIIDLDSICTIADQFGSINPAFYDAWDYDLRKSKTPTSVIDGNLPLVYELTQNYPNPFNPTTKIEYSIPVQAQVELKIYNVVGQEVATLVNEVQKAGIYHVRFGASNLSSGVYFYRLNAGNFTSVKKMVMLK